VLIRAVKKSNAFKYSQRSEKLSDLISEQLLYKILPILILYNSYLQLIFWYFSSWRMIIRRPVLDWTTKHHVAKIGFRED
jgi:hypothetical protein